MNVLYTAHGHVTGGRVGQGTGSNDYPDLRIDRPVALGGPADVRATNPEELFAIGYGACYLSALSLVARGQKISAKAFTIDSEVNLQEDGGQFGIAVKLVGTLPGVEREKALELMEAAHAVCPYSNATRGNIQVTLEVAEG